MPGQVIEGHAKWEDDCTKCHKRFDKAAQTILCLDCHKEVRKDVDHQQGFHGRFKEQQECKECHTDHKGRAENIAPLAEPAFDHEQTDFPLSGAHANQKKVECKACHTPKVKYRDTPSDCYGCHKKDDKHKGVYGEKCAACHGENDWKTITFDHDIHTHYPLRGKHRTTTCASCHKGHLYNDKTPSDCNGCHQKDDKHKSRFSEACARCHTERDWKILLFDHNRDTSYPLKGGHRKTKCDTCHIGLLYTDKTPTDCFACHRKTDIHKGRFSEACTCCHTEQDWKTLLFNHDRNTTYPLLGKHRMVTCQSCHKGTLYTDKTSIDCYSCHQRDDTHQRRLGSQCEDCHNARDWKIWDFQHDTRTRFKLDGGHAGLSCYECHTTPMGKQVVLSPACTACHKKDDPHSGGFGPQCERCHETTHWRTLKRGSGGFRLP